MGRVARNAADGRRLDTPSGGDGASLPHADGALPSTAIPGRLFHARTIARWEAGPQQDHRVISRRLASREGRAADPRRRTAAADTRGTGWR